ncbi:MAG TPA: type II secretion system F family protein [Chloroflexota bacterium]|nr:type II secretion system F family protein [Chloroflexota bacterium]
MDLQLSAQLVPLVAPVAMFVAVMLLGAGIYRTANHGGLIARKRLSAFAPAPSGVVAMPMIEGSPLLKHERFSTFGLLDRLLHRNERGHRIALELARAALPLRVGEYLLLRWVLGLAFAFIVTEKSKALPIGLIAGVAGYFLPALYVRYRQNKRVREFDDQLVDALTLIANALKSGYSFLQGMEAIAREMPAPIGVEFEQALREIRVGGSVEDALGAIHERVRSVDFEMVVTAMVIQRQVGGNLTEILTSIAYTVRERHRILREVRVLTSQERMSGYVIAGLPVFMVVALSLLSPGYISGMWRDELGKIILSASAVMELVGLLVIRKIVEIDV